jgi:sec-independent protein translocase protein TatA
MPPSGAGRTSGRRTRRYRTTKTERESPMPNLGGPELLIILAIVLLLFGATRLPKLGKGLGQSIRGFKKGLNEDSTDEIEEPDQAQIEKRKDETLS